MPTVAELSAAERANLFAQVGTAMNNPGFNLDAHIAGNTVNGVFTPPTNNPPPPPTSNPNTSLPISPPAPVLPVYTSRFNTSAEAIAYAQANGQGQLTVAADGSTTNRFGEKMVFDSSGNLAPAPKSGPPVINPTPV